MSRPCIITTLFVLIFIFVCPARGVPIQQCDNVQSWTATEEVLATPNYGIWDITVSHYTGNIYLALYARDALLVINNDTLRYDNITVEKVTAVVADSTLPILYIGTYSGLQIYDELSGDIRVVPEIKYGTWDFCSPKNKNELYVVTSSAKHDVYRFDEKETNLNIQARFGFVVDDNDNYQTKLQLKGCNDTITYKDGPFYSLSVDNEGRVFGFSRTNYSLYHLKADRSSQFVTTSKFRPKHMKFDRNNNAVIGTFDNEIIIMKFKCFSTPDTKITSDNDITLTVNSQNTKEEFNRILVIIADNAMEMNEKINKYNSNLESKLKSMEDEIKQLSLSIRQMNKVDLDQPTNNYGRQSFEQYY